jgi:sigma-B regulation protein RsbU (phosphoserine phosphatase)
VPLRKSTRVWIVVFAAAVVASIVLHRVVPEPGCWGILVALVVAQAACILLWRAGRALFRLIIRRLTLRLAFSYFLIGVVPIPLLAALLFVVAYILANQYVANRLRREVTAVGETAARSDARLPEIAVRPDGTVTASPLPWLSPGSPAPWAAKLDRPGFLVNGEEVWLAVRRDGSGAIRLLALKEPDAPWLQQLADRTGYEVGVDVGTSSSRDDGPSFNISSDPDKSGLRVKKRRGQEDEGFVRRLPAGEKEESGGIWRRTWVHAFYLETALNAPEASSGEHVVAVLMGVTSPRTLFHQLFAQGVDQIGTVFRVAVLGLGLVVLVVYTAALAVAFVLVGSIARNVNRLTRATRAVAGGDLTVRVNSRSRDQIGDLARSFDGMAASIQDLLSQAARKERLESEIAIARTIQQKLLPPPEARLDGVGVLAHFAPMAEIGGDYYDYLTMPDGRIAFALGDVSGHGLPTGLLVAMAKSALSSLVEAGHDDGELFARLNDLIHRSTDPRHYMTLAFLAYDPRSREGVLTNAGQLAPYRVRGTDVASIALPSFPLGLFPGKTFPSHRQRFEPGDLVVFLSDGFVEAAGSDGDPFGFDRFERVLRERAPEGAAAVRDALLAALAAHTGSTSPEDDRTLLILTVGAGTPESATAIESPAKSSE